MKKSVFVQYLVISILLFAGTQLSASEQDQRVGESLFERAEALYREGNLDAASGIIAGALEFFPNSSEALYLSALIDLARQETTLRGIDKLRMAVKAASWTKTDPDTALQSLAEVLLRIGRHDEAISLLRRLVAGRPEVSRNIYLLADAYLESGRHKEAESAIGNALRLFPKTEGLYLLSARLHVQQEKTVAAREAISAGLREIPDSPSLLLKEAELEPDRERRIRAVDEYAAKGGSAPLAAVIALEAEPKQPQPYLSMFLSHNGLSRLDLTRRVSAVTARSEQLARSFAEELSKYTGNRDLDRFGEGYYEERWEYRDGTPLRWVRDKNRDGAPEYIAEFADGRVTALSMPRGDAIMTIGFEEYPFVATVTRTDKSGKKAFTLAPRVLGSYLLDASARSLPEGAFETAASFHVPTDSEILKAAVREEDFLADGVTGIRRIEIDRGKRTYMEEDAGGHGIIDHKLWYSEGQPVKGLRDLRGDGAWQVTESYRAGALWKSVADTDGNGKPDYTERRDGGLVKLWDYNEDGVDDCREFAGANGSVVREFSTALNGKFDLRTVFKNGRIIAVSKNGRPLAVTPDKKAGVTWIGKPGGFQIQTDAREGIVSFRGRAYLLFRFQDNLYVEVLE